VKEVLAVANTAIGLAVLLGPICLAVIVLLAVEMTDRIPFPEAGAPATARPSTLSQRDWEELTDQAPNLPTWTEDRAETDWRATPLGSRHVRVRLRRIK
jgi:hypothetical protein